MSRDTVTVHYLHEADDGPIYSGPAGVHDPSAVMPALGVAITPKRYRFACHAKAVPSHHHRGTNSLDRMAGDRFIVNCPKCLQSERFLADVASAEQRTDPATMFDAQGNCCS